MIACLLLFIAIASASPIGELDIGANLDLPQDVSQDVKASLASSQLIDINTALIIQQATFPRLAMVEDLPVHQEAVKVTARSWRSHVRSALFNVNDAILAFTYQFDAFYDPLFEYADELGTAEGKETFVVLLEEVKTEIGRQRTATVNAGDQLRAFLHSMMDHNGTIGNDVERITRANNGHRGAIADMRRRIDALDAAIREDEKQLNAGRIVFWSTFFIPGINLIGANMVQGASSAMNAKLHEKRDLIMQIAHLDSQIALADYVFRDVVALTGYIGKVVNATENLNKAWSQLERDYDNVIGAVNAVDPNASKNGEPLKVRILKITVKSKLRAAKTQWNALADSAREIKLTHLRPPVRGFE